MAVRKKKVVASRSQMRQKAKEAGATLKNAKGQELDLDHKPVPPSKPAIPPGPDENYKLIADTLREAADKSAKLLKDIRDQMNLQRLEASQPPAEWVFDVVRDENGFIKTIRATVPNNKKTLN